MILITSFGTGAPTTPSALGRLVPPDHDKPAGNAVGKKPRDFLHCIGLNHHRCCGSIFRSYIYIHIYIYSYMHLIDIYIHVYCIWYCIIFLKCTHRHDIVNYQGLYTRPPAGALFLRDLQSGSLFVCGLQRLYHGFRGPNDCTF